MDAPSLLPSSLLPISSNVSDSSPTDPSSNLVPSVTSVSTKPMPLLPTELKREILRFCDPSTLAKTSLLSSDFLELSSPLLYTDVFIDSPYKLASLFCYRDEHSSSPRLEPYLSLGQIKHFTYLALLLPTTPTPGDDAVLARARLQQEVQLGQLRPNRIPPSSSSPSAPRTLAVTSLTVQIKAADCFLEEYHYPLYTFFNPLTFKLEAIGLDGTLTSLPSAKVNPSLWTRLDTFLIQNVRLQHGLYGLKPLNSRFQVVWDLTDPVVNTSSGLNSRGPLQALEERGYRSRRGAAGAEEMMLKKVVVRVRMEQERKNFFRSTQSWFERQGAGGEEKRDALADLEVIVVG